MVRNNFCPKSCRFPGSLQDKNECRRETLAIIESPLWVTPCTLQTATYRTDCHVKSSRKFSFPSWF